MPRPRSVGEHTNYELLVVADYKWEVPKGISRNKPHQFYGEGDELGPGILDQVAVDNTFAIEKKQVSLFNPFAAVQNAMADLFHEERIVLKHDHDFPVTPLPEKRSRTRPW